MNQLFRDLQHASGSAVRLAIHLRSRSRITDERPTSAFPGERMSQGTATARSERSAPAIAASRVFARPSGASGARCDAEAAAIPARLNIGELQSSHRA